MKERERQLSPTDKQIEILEEIKDNDRFWEVAMSMLGDEDWRFALEEAGVDLDRLDERAREIGFERKHIVGTPFLE